MVMGKKLTAFCKDFWINKGLTEDEAIFKVKSFKKINKEYWIVKGYNEDEAILKVKEFQSSMSKRNFEKLNKLDKKSFEYKSSFNTNIEFYLKRGYSLDEAKDKVKNRQSTFSLEKCIDKYGKEEGEKIWKERQNKWQNTLSNLDNIDEINKSKDSVSWDYCIKKANRNLDKAKEIREKRILDIIKPWKFSSNESINIFKPFYNNLLDLRINDDDIYFDYDNKKEFFINDGKKIYFYDFTIRSKKLIIEYNGSAFHPNPLLTDKEKSKWKRLYSDVNYEDAVNEDNRKIIAAIDKGFNVFVIWDTDSIEKRNIIFEQVLKNINE